MNRGTVIELLNQGHISSRNDLLKYKIPHKAAGSGAFRQSFIIFPKNIEERFVIKFPINKAKDNIYHSQTELKAISKINNTQKLAFLRRFLPKILYSHNSTGIIAMEYYKKAKDAAAVAFTLQLAYSGLYPERDFDVEYYNVRESPNGEYKIVDLGCFEFGTTWQDDDGY